jgi:phosphate:Na+ symporter
VGTTFTAALASVGGAVATRRTGFAHVIYNIMIGAVAFVLLYPLEWGIGKWQALGHVFDPQIGLVAFHTAFNLLGLCIVIGFTPWFARLVIWLVPDTGPALTSKLDDRLLGHASPATYAADASVVGIANALFAILVKLLEHGPDHGTKTALQAVADASRETRAYSQNIQTSQADAAIHARHMAVIHSLDHLSRLHHRCGQEERISLLADDPELAPIARELVTAIKTYIDGQEPGDAEDRINEIRQRLEATGQDMREATIDLASQGATDTDAALLRLDAIRWLRRVSYHTWRIMLHRSGIEMGLPQPEPDTAVKADDGEG